MKLNHSNYFSLEADREYLSNSQIKDMLSCSARAMAYLGGEFSYPTTDSMLLGSLVHAYFDSKEAVRKIIEENKDRFCKKNGELYEKFNYIPLVETLEKDEFAMYYLTGKHEQIYTAELFGAKIKIQIDCLNDFISDLKTMAEIKKEAITEWKYDRQLVLYKMVYEKATAIEIKDLFIVAVSKETPCDHNVFHLNDNNKIEEIKVQWEIDIKQALDIKEGRIQPIRCEKCWWCRNTKKLFMAEELWQ